MDTPPPNINGPMERQDWIAQYILERGSVLVDELVELLDVSRMTIHRDLDDLENQGLLRKVRNGATAQPSNLFESDVRYRLKQQMEEKQAIAETILQHIEPGQAIFMDESTTLLPLVERLTEVAPVTVITNFLPIIKALVEVKNIHLISLGGEYLSRFDTFTGLLCENGLARLYADLYITSTTAAVQGKVFHPEPRVVKVKQQMMEKAQHRYLLLDHTKFNKTALHQWAYTQDFDLVVVDSRTDEQFVRELRDKNTQVEIAPVKTEQKG